MNPDFLRKSYDYALPTGQIAQFPAEQRDCSRLLILDCRINQMQDVNFSDIPKYFSPGDLLVVNDTRVFPARIEGRKDTGGKVEMFLLEYPDIDSAPDSKGQAGSQKQPAEILTVVTTALLKSSKKLKSGSRIIFNQHLEAELIEYLADGKARVNIIFKLDNGLTPDEILASSGRVPLPPYIHRDTQDLPEDRERYQTVFAKKTGAVAAPTAGLHFSEALLNSLAKKNIRIASITLHVGYGTFAPVRVEDIRNHRIHEEYVEISRDTAQLINQTRNSGNRVWAVGTTTVRALEFAADETGRVKALQGWCGLYIYPGYRFKIVNGLITNFHLPGSSLLFLVAALAGRARILKAYEKAVQLGFRFYSYGDAMLIIC